MVWPAQGEVMRYRRLLVAAIIVLVVVECLFLLAAGSFELMFSRFSLGPLTTEEIQDNVRSALTLQAWFLLTSAGLIAFVLRHRGWGGWVLGAIQVGDLGESLWAGLTQFVASCGSGGAAWLALAGVAGVALALLYLLWRRVDRPRPARAAPGPANRAARILSALAITRSRYVLAAIAGVMLSGAALIGIGWSMSVLGLASHSGIVSAAVADKYGLNLTLDSSPHGYYFDAYSFGTVPNVRAGESVVILTGEACNSGIPVALQAPGLGRLWIASGYDSSISPYTPATWQEHETLRWLLFGLGAAVALLGLVGLLIWVG